VIRVFVLGEIRLYREGLADLLVRGGLEVAGTGTGPVSTGSTVSSAAPDIVMVDVAGSDGVAAIRQLVDALPDIPVVAFGVSGSNAEVLACAEAGARGYVTRDQSREELFQVLECVARGEALCSPQIAAALIQRVADLARAVRVEADAPLTRRELEIATLVEEGLSNKEIARVLVIEVSTVKSHVHNILEKLKVRRRSDAAAWVRGRR
jgi:DNA-binding NarL/FixJ family response regulator